MILYIKYIFFLNFLIAISCQQNDKYAELEIVGVELLENQIQLTLELENFSQDTLYFYKPVLQDACNSILTIRVKDRKGRLYNYLPCKSIVDLESIIVKEDDMLLLSSKNKKELRFLMDVDQFSPFIDDLKSSFIRVGFNYEEADFLNKNHIIFGGELLSEWKKIQ